MFSKFIIIHHQAAATTCAEVPTTDEIILVTDHHSQHSWDIYEKAWKHLWTTALETKFL